MPFGQRWLDCVVPFPVAFSLTISWPAFSSGSRLDAFGSSVP